MKKPETSLLVAASDHDANMLYAVGMFVPDPFIYFNIRNRRYMVMSDLEIDRARKQARGCHILPLSSYQKKLRREGVKSPGLAEVLPRVLRQKGVRRVTVPFDFPHGLAVQLQRNRISVTPKKGDFFPERELKSADEVRKLSAALAMAEVGMAEAMQALRAAKIGKDRRLVYRNAPLTSEKLRAIVDTAIVQMDGRANHTIVAGGNQACDPHESGFGPLRANEPIIIDIFPRSQKTGYFGDITRTVVRGRASDLLKHAYHCVAQGQEIAFRKIKDGASAYDLHFEIVNYFTSEGFPTGSIDGRMQGFFHGAGHGLGLDLHEAPSFGSRSKNKLRSGNVVTVEPGLYYQGMGGVRLEDVVVVTKTGCNNLVRIPKRLEV